MIIGAQNLRLASNKGLEVLSGRDLALKVSAKFSLGSGGLDADLTQVWTFAPDKLQISSDATGASDPVRKSQLDTFAQGLRVKETVRLATTEALPSYTHASSVLTAAANGALSIDGTGVSNGDRILVKDETAGNAPYNGWYVVTNAGDGSNPFVLTRSSDANTAAEVAAGSFSYVSAGTANNNTRWAVTGAGAPAVLNTNAVAFTSLGASFTAGAGLTSSGTTVDVVSADDSLTVNANSVQVKLDAAGGITVNSGQGLKVGVDNSTIELNTNALRIKDAGVTNAKLANNAVESAKLKMVVRFEKITGVTGNGTSLTLSRAIVSGREEQIMVTEDNASIDYNVSPGNNKEFSASGTTLTLGGTQVDGAVYRVWYPSEAA